MTMLSVDKIGLMPINGITSYLFIYFFSTSYIVMTLGGIMSPRGITTAWQALALGHIMPKFGLISMHTMI